MNVSFVNMHKVMVLIRRQGSAGATAKWLAERLGISVGNVQQRIFWYNDWLRSEVSDKAIVCRSGRYIYTDAEFSCDADVGGAFGGFYYHDYGGIEMEAV